MEESKVKKIIIGVVIALLILVVIVMSVMLGKQNKEKYELKQEINEIKDAIGLPEDAGMQGINPAESIQTDQ